MGRLSIVGGGVFPVDLGSGLCRMSCDGALSWHDLLIKMCSTVIPHIINQPFDVTKHQYMYACSLRGNVARGVFWIHRVEIDQSGHQVIKPSHKMNLQVNMCHHPRSRGKPLEAFHRQAHGKVSNKLPHSSCKARASCISTKSKGSSALPFPDEGAASCAKPTIIHPPTFLLSPPSLHHQHHYHPTHEYLPQSLYTALIPNLPQRYHPYITFSTAGSPPGIH